MTYGRYWMLLVCLFIGTLELHASTGNEDPPAEGKADKTVSYQLNQQRDFASLQAFDFVAYEEAPSPYFIENYATLPSLEQQGLREKVEATYQKVLDENRFVEFLDLTSFIELPIGINKDIGGVQYTILIDSVVMTPLESFLYASMRFKLPQADKAIHFIGRDIRFSASGGLTGDGVLQLIGDYPINLGGKGEDNSAKSQLVIKGEAGGTFVEFDCNGYKQFSLDASLVFSRDLLIPEGPNGERLEDENVAINVQTTLVDWNDLLITANIPAFQVKGVKDMSFTVQNAVIDLSDTRNAPSVVFPQGYNEISPMLSSGTPELWRGVYIRELTVALPRQFKKAGEEGSSSSASDRISFSGLNMLIDNMGFSGILSAENLIPIDKGKIGNWAFSLEQIYVGLLANEINEAGFNGRVNIPINTTEGNQQASGGNAEEGKFFTYTAQIKPNNEYIFNVSNADKLNFDLWKADVTLDPTSYVEIKLVQGQFRPKAHLDGMMTMNIGMKGDSGSPEADESKNAKLAKITFQDLEVQTVKPYVRVGSFSLGVESDENKMGGFPLRINEISGGMTGEEIFLGIDITLSLIKENDGGFAANGKLKLVSQAVENGNDLRYRFKKLQVERFAIDIDQGNFAFKGVLNFYKEDPIYGNGISGTIEATFRPTFQIQASAIFGTKDGNRYFYVDAKVNFSGGIPLFPGINLYGFGGGAYYGMSIDTKGVGSPLGQTASGMVYVPDANVAFGFKASVFLGLPKEEALFIEATYEMAFNKGGGVKYINFVGNGYFFVTPDNGADKLTQNSEKLAAVAKGSGDKNLNEGSGTANAEAVYGPPGGLGDRAQAYVTVNILFDFENNTLHGNAQAFINAAGGLIKGSGAGGKAGEVVFHFAPGEWYVYIGRPEYENRFGITVAGLATLDAYFVIGSVIPDTPPPPPEVSEILGDIDLDYMGDMNTLADGGGFGFGASFRVDTGDVSFLMFYARFRAGLGFDLMLKDYGDAECKGRGQVGLNGWFANAQAYAYFEGKIGIRVKIFGKRKSFEILAIGAAVVVQAKLPNPAWFRGIVGGYFRILGGMIKGTCKFELEIGEECELIRSGSVLETVEVIAQVTPQENTKDIDVFTVPQAVFNYEMEKEYQMVDYDESIIKFKISLDKFEIKDGTKVLDSDQTWNDDHTVLALNSFDILPPKKELTVSVVAKFKELKDGYWSVVKVDGQELVEAKTIKFTTGEAPDHIPAENVAYSYPTQGQFNFYKNEHSQGYVTLVRGQPYLFEKSDRWTPKLRVKTIPEGNAKMVNLNYVASAKEVRFNIPAGLPNDKVFALEIVNVPNTTLTEIDANVSEVNTKVQGLEGTEVDLEMRSRQATGTIEEVQEKVIYQANFRTSKYNTAAAKIASVNPSSGWRDPIMTGVHAVGSNIKGPEPFSEEEILGRVNFEPLFQLEADLSNNTWYNQDIYPMIYEGYPIMGQFRISSSNRDPSVLGVVPKKAVYLYQYPWNFNLTEDNITLGTVQLRETVGRFDYYLAKFMYYDFMDLSNQAANYVSSSGGSNTRLNKLLNGTFPAVRKGDYWVNIKYVLPGKNTVTSTYRHKIYNPLD